MRNTPREVISIYSPTLDYFDSYGLLACQLARSLTRAGVYVNLLTHNGQKPHSSQPADIRAIAEQELVDVDGGVLMGYPSQFYRFGRRADRGRRVAVTMFESTKLPQRMGWVEELNTCDVVLPPSTFCANLFRDEGVEAPIHVAPLGVSSEYQFATRPDRDTFTFLAFADRGLRKGWDIAARALVTAFGDDPHYRLIIKHLPRERQFNVTNPNIAFWPCSLEIKALAWLYQQADCLVFPAEGEGFGLIPREFAATGGMVLATAWGGLADGIEDYAEPLDDFDMVPAWDGHELFDGVCGDWARVNVDALAAKMDWVAHTSAWFRNEIGRERSAKTRSRWTWDKWAAIVLAAYRGEPLPSPGGTGGLALEGTACFAGQDTE